MVWWILFVLVATWMLNRTRIGNWIFAVGGNAAQRPRRRCAGEQGQDRPVHGRRVPGLVLRHAPVVRVQHHPGRRGVGQEFLFIIAAVVGGTLLTGGYGSAIGTAIGAFIFGMTQQGIVYAGWDPNWFKAFLGVMLLLAVAVNLSVKKFATTRKA